MIPCETLAQRRIVCLVWTLLLPLHLLLLGGIALRMSPTSDEVAHLAAGVRYWETGRVDLYQVNPPLVKAVAALPVVWMHPRTNWSRISTDPGAREEWAIGRDFMVANGSHTWWHFLLARCACFPFSCLGVLLCWWWSREMFGPFAGLAAATLWTFSPAILGNGALITPDVPAASLSLAMLFAFRSWLRSHTWASALLAGLCSGLALLTKFTVLLWLPGLLVAAILSQTRWSPTAWRATSRNMQTAQFLLLVLVALNVVWLGYNYEHIGEALGQQDFVSNTLKGHVPESTGNRFRGTWLGRLPLPLPPAYLQGLDLQRRDLEGRWRPLMSYMAGESRDHGWWFYYLYALAVKGTLAGWALAMLTALCMLRTFSHSIGFLREWSWLLLPPLALLTVLSLHTEFSRYLRYLLPAWGFAIIAVSSLFVASNPRWLRHLAASLLVLGVLESVAVWPNSLAFFNVAVGGPLQGHRHLLDSNLDWGQDLYALNDWLDGQPENTIVHVAYAGVVDPQWLDRRFQPYTRTANETTPTPPGWYAISANQLHGYDTPFGPWHEFLNRAPTHRIGASLFLFEVPR